MKLGGNEQAVMQHEFGEMNGLADAMKQEVLHFADETGLLNRGYILEMVQKGITKSKMWYLYNLAMWYREYIG